MKDWLVFTLLAFLFWGVWGFLNKIATLYIPAKAVFFYQVAAFVIVAIICVPLIGLPNSQSSRGIIFAALAGVFLVVGDLLYIFAMSKGKAAFVVTITGLSPILTIILAIAVLREAITIKQAIGIALGVLSMGLIAS